MSSQQSKLPPPVILQMSSTTAGPPVPTPSPLPFRPSTSSRETVAVANAKGPQNPSASFPTPKLLLKIKDLSSKGTRDFLSSVNASTIAEDAVKGVFTWLYEKDSVLPTTRSVTLVLRAMDGVAYTTGKDIDDDHKEIHFSTNYIDQISSDRKGDEILGVLRHEMVHCFQYNGYGTAPGGLIEGIADWVRLKSGLVPPHWTRDADGDWDAGYQHTGYFLEYLEKRFGVGTVVAINRQLRTKTYDEDKFWPHLFGHKVNVLWRDYGKSLKGELENEEEPVMVEMTEVQDDNGQDAVEHAGNQQGCVDEKKSPIDTSLT